MTQPRLVFDTPIFHKIYDLYKLLSSYQNRIPKTQRYTLWSKCETTNLVILERLIETSYLLNEERIHSLHALSHKLDLLKVLIRLAKDTRTIDQKQYLEVQAIMQEIGKMIGGWIKSVPR